MTGWITSAYIIAAGMNVTVRPLGRLLIRAIAMFCLAVFIGTAAS